MTPIATVNVDPIAKATYTQYCWVHFLNFCVRWLLQQVKKQNLYKTHIDFAFMKASCFLNYHSLVQALSLNCSLLQENMFFAFTWSSHFFSLQCIFTNWEPHSIKMLPWELPSLLITVFITFNNLSTLFLFSLWTLIFTICSFSAFKSVIFWFHAFLCIQQSLFVFSLFITLQSFSTFTFNFIWLTTKSWNKINNNFVSARYSVEILSQSVPGQYKSISILVISVLDFPVAQRLSCIIQSKLSLWPLS